MIFYEAFDYVKYEFFFLLIVSLGLFINVTFIKKSVLNNWVAVISISFICVVISALNLYMLGVSADELNIGVEYINSIMFITILFLAIINSIISYFSKGKGGDLGRDD